MSTPITLQPTVVEPSLAITVKNVEQITVFIDPTIVDRKCIATKDCGGTVQDIHTPQPNREETDRVAAEYYKSGRTLEVQFWDSKQWTQGDWQKDNGFFTPTFDYSIPWRIKPKKRRVVVDVWQGERSGEVVCYEHGNKGSKVIQEAGLHKFLGTIEGEVEA